MYYGLGIVNLELRTQFNNSALIVHNSQLANSRFARLQDLILRSGLGI